MRKTRTQVGAGGEDEMANESSRARVLRVVCERGNAGLFYATSPDLKGLLVAEPSMDALKRVIPEAIAELYARDWVKVVVTEVDQDGDPSGRWVAFPAEIAKQALDQL
jgi:hypothetical protein